MPGTSEQDQGTEPEVKTAGGFAAEEKFEREERERLRAEEQAEGTERMTVGATGDAAGKIATGKVSRLYTTENYVAIRLAGLSASLTPANGYFKLRQTHVNYNALYSLALAAAINRFDLTIRTETDITPAEEATARYFVVDWAS